MQIPATKKALSWCAAWIVMGAVAQSSRMAAGGVFGLLVWAPVALVIDWRRSKKISAPSIPQLLLSPPE